jgi:hypothetical protein
LYISPIARRWLRSAQKNLRLAAEQDVNVSIDVAETRVTNNMITRRATKSIKVRHAQTIACSFLNLLGGLGKKL